MDNPSIVKAAKLLSKVGEKRFQDILKAIKLHSGLVDALETSVGKEILDESVKRMEELLKKIIEEEATSEDKAEFRVLRKIADKWAHKINRYQKLRSEIE